MDQEQEVGFEQGECIGLSLCEDVRGFVVEGRPAQEHDCEEGDIGGCTAAVAGRLDILALVEENCTPLSWSRLLSKCVCDCRVWIRLRYGRYTDACT